MQISHSTIFGHYMCFHQLQRGLNSKFSICVQPDLWSIFNLIADKTDNTNKI